MRGESLPGEVYTWVLQKRYLESVRLHFARSWRPAHLRNHNRRFHPVRLPRRPAHPREAQATPPRRPPRKAVQPPARITQAPARRRLANPAQRWTRTARIRTAPRANPSRSAIATAAPPVHRAQPEHRIQRGRAAARPIHPLDRRQAVPAPMAPVLPPAARERARVPAPPAQARQRLQRRLLLPRNPQLLEQPRLRRQRPPQPRSSSLYLTQTRQRARRGILAWALSFWAGVLLRKKRGCGRINRLQQTGP